MNLTHLVLFSFFNGASEVAVVVGADITLTELARIVTIGSDVLIGGGQPVRLYGLKGEAASTTTVTLKDGAVTQAILAAGAIPLSETVKFKNSIFRNGLSINIAAGGQNLLVLWRYV